MFDQAGTLLAVPTDDDVGFSDSTRFDAELDGNDARDAEVVRRFQRGELGAFVELYERHFGHVYRYLCVLLRDHHEAEDVAQQAFTKAYQALDRFELRRGKPFRCWLFRIARNEALSHLRKHSRIEVEETERIELHLEGPCAPDALKWLSDAEVLGFVERLPMSQRQVLALRYGLSLSTQEVAEMIGRTPVAVRKLEHRALRFLEQRLNATGHRGTRRAPRAAMLIRVRRAPVLGARRFALAAPLGAPARLARW